MTFYKKKYRVETNGHASHSYAEGMYFVTICTKKKMQWFGEIVDDQMTLNEMGKVAEKNLIEIPKHFTGVKILSHVIMPNHIHVILCLPTVETRESRVSVTQADTANLETLRIDLSKMGVTDCSGRGITDSSETGRTNPSETRESRVSTKEAPQNEPRKTFTLNSKTLGSIINQLKGTITKRIWAAGFGDFHWQPRYHDHIIRSEKELSAIKKYIASNPDTWDKETIPWHADGASWSL